MVAFDKTGTLTSGQPRIVHLACDNIEENELLRLAGALQQGSEHPLARAVLDAAGERGLTLPPLTASQALAGRGIRGEVAGRALALGNQRLFDELQLDSPLREQATAWEAEGAPCPG